MEALRVIGTIIVAVLGMGAIGAVAGYIFLGPIVINLRKYYFVLPYINLVLAAIGIYLYGQYYFPLFKAGSPDFWEWVGLPLYYILIYSSMNTGLETICYLILILPFKLFKEGRIQLKEREDRIARRKLAWRSEYDNRIPEGLPNLANLNEKYKANVIYEGKEKGSWYTNLRFGHGNRTSSMSAEYPEGTELTVIYEYVTSYGKTWKDTGRTYKVTFDDGSTADIEEEGETHYEDPYSYCWIRYAKPVDKMFFKNRRKYYTIKNRKALATMIKEGDSASEAGDHQKAYESYKEASRLLELMNGGGYSAELYGLLDKAADECLELNRYEEGKEIAEKSLEIKMKSNSFYDEDVIDSKIYLEKIEEKLEHFDKALELTEELLKIYKDYIVSRDEEKFQLRNNHAVLLTECERYEEAFVELGNLLAEERKVLGDSHPRTIWTMACIGLPLYMIGHEEEARARLNDAIDLCRSNLDTGSYEYIETMNEIAYGFMFMESWQELYDLCSELIPVSIGNQGEDSSMAQLFRCHMATAALKLGKIQEVYDLSSEYIRYHEENGIPYHSLVIESMQQKAYAAALSGRYDEAKEILDKALSACRTFDVGEEKYAQELQDNMQGLEEMRRSASEDAEKGDAE